MTVGQEEQKTLFTPGPLMTTRSVKRAMLRDVFPRTDEFTEITRDILQRILNVSGAPAADWSVVLTQGCGTFGLDAVLQTTFPHNKEARVLILSNGFYAGRLVQMAEVAGFAHDVLDFGEAQPFDVAKVAKQLDQAKYAFVTLVHCESSNGILNPVDDVAKLVRSKQPSAVISIDAMSCFGAVPLQYDNLDFVTATPNKVTQGVPGFCIVLARIKCLQKFKGNARTMALDLAAQHEDLEKYGQFRFTPPSHVLLAAQQALKEFEAEGGPTVRAKRYQSNAKALVAGARRLGFKTLLPDKYLSPILTSFLYPKHPKFILTDFCAALYKHGFVLFPGKLTYVDSFRIGTIGDINTDDVENLLKAIEVVLKDMDIPVPISQ